MATTDSKLNVVGADFDEIKSNLIAFLRDQNVLQDADYTGSVLSILTDLLAYNTHYNAYYLNMVANEMFLDSCVKRASTISHAKVLGYLPHSFSAPTATVSLDFIGVTADQIILPKYTKFISETIDNVNYTYVTLEEYILKTDKTNNTISVSDIEIKQGEPLGYTFVYDETSNPNAKFKIPDGNVDLSTLKVIVQKSTTDIRSSVYNYPEDMLAIDGESEIYFIQETFDGSYEIYFGDGILGKKLNDGCVIYISYLSVNPTIVQNISNFYLVSPSVGDYSGLTITTTTPSIGGRYKETINSIKNLAPKAYQAQERAVTINDYIALIQKRSGEYPIDSVNVWSGEENSPPVYGRVYVAIKPKGKFTVTTNEKNRIIADLISPMSVITVKPVIVDVDYSYLQVLSKVLYDPTKTTLTHEQLRTSIIAAIRNYGRENLNNFNSTLILSDVIQTIQNVNPSIITNEPNFKLEKRFTPTLQTPLTYSFDFGIPIKRDLNRQGVTISPSIQVIDKDSTKTLRTEVFIEEVPTSATSIESIIILNPGYNYKSVPTVTIRGDGQGASARAIIINERIEQIIIDNPGNNYTQAIVEISGGGGVFGSASVVLQKQFGILRTYYFNKGVKYILNNNVGTVDYYNGIVTLENFNPYNINNFLAQLSINIVPDTTIIYSKHNKMLVMDDKDLEAVKINLIKK